MCGLPSSLRGSLVAACELLAVVCEIYYPSVCVCVCVCVCVRALNFVRLFVTTWTVVHQASLSVEFPRREYWSGLPFPSSLTRDQTQPHPPAPPGWECRVSAPGAGGKSLTAD